MALAMCCYMWFLEQSRKWFLEQSRSFLEVVPPPGRKSIEFGSCA
jgi:hypothetical protein